MVRLLGGEIKMVSYIEGKLARFDGTVAQNGKVVGRQQGGSVTMLVWCQ